jgi:hypothetical protein
MTLLDQDVLLNIMIVLCHRYQQFSGEIDLHGEGYLHIFEITVKRILTITLLFAYLICVSGVRINVHYCGGKIKDISFFQVKEKDGCCGNKMRSKNCCKDKLAILKVKDIHKSIHSLKVPNATSQLKNFIVPEPLLNFCANNISSDMFVDSPDPPDLNVQDIYLNNRVLLI